jgi:nicotinate-nucleotide adenylyltransferase
MSDPILLFGGTFDPVHMGHLITARSAAEAVGARKVILLPTGVNPLKTPPQATPEQRLNMLRLAVTGDDLFEVSDVELHRRPPCYTIDTVEELLRGRPQGTSIALVIGADMLADLHCWRRVGDLLNLARVIVACRPPTDIDGARRAIDALADKLPAEHLRSLAKSAVATPLIDISSTDIRRRRAKNLSIRFLVPEAVRTYIEENRIYA